MADQNFIDQTTNELTQKIKQAQEEVVSVVNQLVKGKSKTESIAIIN